MGGSGEGTWKRRAGLIALLTGLYACQGLPFGFLARAIPYELREQGRSLGFISLTVLLNVPWALKFLWAPALDRYWLARMGRRRSWLLPLQLLLAVVLLAASRFTVRDDLAPLLACVALIALVSATQDIAVDGLAVDRLTPDDRGLGNAVQLGAYRLGMIAGGGLILSLSAPERWGWTPAVACMAAAPLLMAFVVAGWREPSPVHVLAGAPPRGLGETFTSFVRQPGAWAILAFVFAYKIGDSLPNAVTTPFLKDSGVSRDQVAILTAYIGSGVSLVGALAAGLAVRRLGRLKALCTLGLFHAAAAATYGVAALVPAGEAGPGGRWSWLVAASVLDHLSGAMATTALFTFMMDLADPEDGGTHYTIQACAVVLCQLGMGAAGGFLADRIGYAGHFLTSAVLCALPPLLALRLSANPLVRKRLPERYW